MGLLSPTSLRNPILQAVGLECGLLHFINLKKILFLMTPVAKASCTPSCHPRGRALCLGSFCHQGYEWPAVGSMWLQSFAIKHPAFSSGCRHEKGSSLGAFVFVIYWAVPSVPSDAQKILGGLRGSDQFCSLTYMSKIETSPISRLSYSSLS